MFCGQLVELIGETASNPFNSLNLCLARRGTVGKASHLFCWTLLHQYCIHLHPLLSAIRPCQALHGQRRQGADLHGFGDWIEKGLNEHCVKRMTNSSTGLSPHRLPQHTYQGDFPTPKTHHRSGRGHGRLSEKGLLTMTDYWGILLRSGFHHL